MERCQINRRDGGDIFSEGSFSFDCLLGTIRASFYGERDIYTIGGIKDIPESVPGALPVASEKSSVHSPTLSNAPGMR